MTDRPYALVTGASGVACLMSDTTGTEFFERADMRDTKVGFGKKMDASTMMAEHLRKPVHPGTTKHRGA